KSGRVALVLPCPGCHAHGLRRTPPPARIRCTPRAAHARGTLAQLDVDHALRARRSVRESPCTRVALCHQGGPGRGGDRPVPGPAAHDHPADGRRSRPGGSDRLSVTTAMSGIITEDAGTTPVLLVVLSMGTSTLLPW